MNYLKLFLYFFLFNSLNSFSQNPSDTTFLEADTMQEQVKLLPDHLGPIKKTMWGEHGLMRVTHLYPLTPEGRAKELKLRRKMLVLHQIFGFVTLGCMLTADFSGQMILNGHSQYKSVHSAAVTATIGTYFTTAGLALLSPPPMVLRVKQWDAIRVHRLLAALHFSGMVLTPLIAPDAHGQSTTELRKNARFHQISAYTTTALFLSAIVVVKF
jgi:hypothetical protein